MYRLTGILFFLLAVCNVSAQKGTITGRVYHGTTNEPIEYATILIQGTDRGTVSDSTGVFSLQEVNPGFFRLIVSSVGFKSVVSPEIQVQGNQTAFIDIALAEDEIALKEVVVRPNFETRRIESPVSSFFVNVQQIEKSAGVNRDVSKALQTLPGVGAMDPNRNDLIVRGGGPSENVFYLDGIEIPVINHFSTQGSSGGAIGVINPDFVREIDFYTGAFPANRANALSSVMEIRQKEGSKDRIHTKLSVGASDAALTIDGPAGDNATLIVSARQSYLQLLFKALKLPFLPTYNDFQVKYKYEINRKNEITFIGIGAIDHMTLNKELQTTGTESQKYILNYLPIYEQWNYTVGAVYKRFSDNHLDTWVLSRNMLRNKNYKFEDNNESKQKTSDYLSDEAENKLRFERDFRSLPAQLKVGGGLRYSRYVNGTYRRLYRKGRVTELRYNTALNLLGYQLFAQVSDEYIDSRLKLSFGLNAVGNNFNENMRNPLNQLSPRLSASYSLSVRWSINANLGRYTAQPAYTTMGFKDGEGKFVNRNENLKYIVSDQLVVGFEHRPHENMRLTMEGFYKHYDKYPLSVVDGLSIASKGTDYGQVGDEEIISTGKGRAYGIEIMYKITEWKNLNLTSTYTWFRSEFTDNNLVYRPSSWDTRHLLNLIAGYRIANNWNIATRWRYVGGAPYSPIDESLSSDREAWEVTNQAYIDYSRFNTLRLSDSHQLDVRVDKEFYFNRWLLNLYVDIQNVYNFKSQRPPIYTNRNQNGDIISDPGGDFSKQGLRVLENSSGTILPTIGLIIKM
ncbi:TonB-dependent receptor [Proteiniphilum saccharofermentans]|uniref:TonB-dependent receptor n=1 Tax=Proteiniphilum saccharofermentans TaxID=1642647 RepID=UPI0028A8B5B9|nr:TonB-dependent receptor [Proteiniphilum saccharofermentans]